MYVSICLIVRDDHRYIQEWLEYYLLIGVDHFFITDNLSQPPLKTILQPYIDRGLVTYKYDQRPRPQIAVYNECLKEHGQKTTWLAFFDSDEFLLLKKHYTIGEFLKEYEEFGAVSICWYLFGSNGHETHQVPLLSAYTTRHPTSCHYKTIVQPKAVKRYEIHHVREHMPGYFTVDEARNRVSGPFTKHQCTERSQLNHYTLRSLADFKEKQLRGGGNNPKGKPLSFFEIINKSATVYDNQILKRIEELKELS